MTRSDNRTTTSSQKQAAVPDDTGEGVNAVRLAGRVSADASTVELPSGDVLVTFRISVARAGGRRPSSAGSSQRTDSVPCVVWSARQRRSSATWRAGDLVEVEGAVRCRFYQAGGATRSRVEVEVSSGRVIRRSSAA